MVLPMMRFKLQRRQLLLASLAFSGGTHALPARSLIFPRDFGAHNDFQTEWWYITGQALAGARAFGFQVTFFRSRVDAAQAMTSRFAAKHLIFAHAAITDVHAQKLWHDQRIARSSGNAASDTSHASESDTAITLGDWSLKRESGDRAASRSSYKSRIRAKDFSMSLRFSETQPLILQGDRGLSRKGPDPAQASYYYSKPQLGVEGQITLQGKTFDLPANSAQAAWLDHEWSNALLHPSAVGWDWIGMNLNDGSALTAFRLRDAEGGTVWAGGSFRSASNGTLGKLRIFRSDEVHFSPLRRWTSPSSRATYPVVWRLDTPSGSYTVSAVIDNQELDSRSSTGAIYWEGLSDFIQGSGQIVGKGYLEMTGYHTPLKL